MVDASPSCRVPFFLLILPHSPLLSSHASCCQPAPSLRPCIATTLVPDGRCFIRRCSLHRVLHPSARHYPLCRTLARKPQWLEDPCAGHCPPSSDTVRILRRGHCSLVRFNIQRRREKNMAFWLVGNLMSHFSQLFVSFWSVVSSYSSKYPPLPFVTFISISTFEWMTWFSCFGDRRFSVSILYST